MRKLKIFVTVLIFTACSGDSALDRDDSFHFFLEEWNLSKTYESGCPSVMDAIKYPEYMSESELTNFVIEDETIRSMSTCGLLETLLDHPSKRLLGPWSTISSDLYLPGVTMFNSSLMENPIAIELIRTGETNHIMAVIMRDLKYAPFLDEVGTEWVEWTFGYVICQTEIVEKYAKEFLKTKRDLP